MNLPLNSIQAIRKYGDVRPLLKAVTTIGTAAVGLLVSMQISKSDEVFSVQNAGLAVGITTAAYIVTNIF